MRQNKQTPAKRTLPNLNLQPHYIVILARPCPHAGTSPPIPSSSRPMPTGVNPAAATSLLGAATSVGASFNADSGGSSVAQGARASKLRVLVPWAKRGLGGLGGVRPGSRGKEHQRERTNTHEKTHEYSSIWGIHACTAPFLPCGRWSDDDASMQHLPADAWRKFAKRKAWQDVFSRGWSEHPGLLIFQNLWWFILAGLHGVL